MDMKVLSINWRGCSGKSWRLVPLCYRFLLCKSNYRTKNKVIWAKWREADGVLCDREVPPQLKGHF